MNKKKLQELVIAALVGAGVTFLTRLAEYLAGIDGQIHQNIVGGSVSALYYIKKAFSHIV